MQNCIRSHNSVDPTTLYELVSITKVKMEVRTLGSTLVPVWLAVDADGVTCKDLCRWVNRNRGYRGRELEARIIHQGQIQEACTRLVDLMAVSSIQGDQSTGAAGTGGTGAAD